MKPKSQKKATQMTDETQAVEPKAKKTIVRGPQEVLVMVTILDKEGNQLDLSDGYTVELALAKPKDWKAVSAMIKSNPKSFVAEAEVPKAS